MKNNVEIIILVVSKMLMSTCVAGLDAGLKWYRPVRLPNYNVYMSDVNSMTGNIQKGNVLIFKPTFRTLKLKNSDLF
jgi:hypothetical protein